MWGAEAVDVLPSERPINVHSVYHPMGLLQQLHVLPHRDRSRMAKSGLVPLSSLECVGGLLA